MGGFSNFAISFSIISILTGAVILYNYGLALGGPGGQRHRLAAGHGLHPADRRVDGRDRLGLPDGRWPLLLGQPTPQQGLGLVDAWLNLGGQISIVAGINYSAALYLGVTILKPIFGFDVNGETLGLLNAIWLTGALMLIEIAFNVAGTKHRRDDE